MAAAAHGDTGVLELVSTEPVDADSVRYVVELTYENDGDHVAGAEVVVTTDDVAPQVMAAEGDGLYSATVDFPAPGDYPVVFAVEEPTAELVVEQVVDTTTTTTTTTTAADAITTFTTTSAEPPAVTEDDSGNGTWLLVVMAVIVAAMVTIAVAYFRGRASASNRPST
jgi:hypothetical protein